MMQPIGSADVAEALARIATEPPRNGTIDLAGPEKIRMVDLVRQFLAAQGDPREVVTEPGAGYFGTEVDDLSLTPDGSPILGHTRFADWLEHSAPAN
jgi:uncharacterized protein YbjT (DUF2867 family)